MLPFGRMAVLLTLQMVGQGAAVPPVGEWARPGLARRHAFSSADAAIDSCVALATSTCTHSQTSAPYYIYYIEPLWSVDVEELDLSQAMGCRRPPGGAALCTATISSRRRPCVQGIAIPKHVDSLARPAGTRSWTCLRPGCHTYILKSLYPSTFTI